MRCLPACCKTSANRPVALRSRARPGAPRCRILRIGHFTSMRHCGVRGQTSQNGNYSHHGARRATAQPAQPLGLHPAQYADGGHGALGIRQVLARVRHHLRRGPAALCGDALGLRTAVFRPDGTAGCGRHRRPLTGHLHRAEDDLAQPALDGGHNHGDLRLPAASLRIRRPAALSAVRAADHSPDGGPDRGTHRGAGSGRAHHGLRSAGADARASSAKSWRRWTSRDSARESMAR